MLGTVATPRLVKLRRRIGERPRPPVIYREPVEFNEATGHDLHVIARNHDLDVVVRPCFALQVEIDRPAAGNCPRHMQRPKCRSDLVRTPWIPRLEIGYEARVVHTRGNRAY